MTNEEFKARLINVLEDLNESIISLSEKLEAL